MTTLITRCTNCKGRKKLLGLGGIYKDCLQCKGIGYSETVITATTKPPIETIAPTTTVDLTKPRRQRKPGQHDKKLVTLTPEL